MIPACDLDHAFDLQTADFRFTSQWISSVDTDSFIYRRVAGPHSWTDAHLAKRNIVLTNGGVITH